MKSGSWYRPVVVPVSSHGGLERKALKAALLIEPSVAVGWTLL